MTIKEVLLNLAWGLPFLAVVIVVTWLGISDRYSVPTPKPLPTMEGWMRNR